MSEAKHTPGPMLEAAAKGRPGIQRERDMSEHPEIWLEPEPPADREWGRQWCQHNVWGERAAHYVLAAGYEFWMHYDRCIETNPPKVAPAPTVSGEPVAWQYRIMHRDWPGSSWGEWSEWRNGRGPDPLTGELYRAEERPLYVSGEPEWAWEQFDALASALAKAQQERDELYNERHLFVIDKERQRLSTELAKAREALDRYRDGVRIDVKMEGPRFMGANLSALKRAWEADLATLAPEGKPPLVGAGLSAETKVAPAEIDEAQRAAAKAASSIIVGALEGK